MKKANQLRPFGAVVSDSIQDPEEAAAYLTAAANDEDERVFLMALKNVIDVHGGLSELSRKTNLNRGNLHRSLTGKGAPLFATVQKMIAVSGFELEIRPKKPPGKATVEM